MRDRLGLCRPVVTVIRDTHHDLCRWNNLYDVLNVALKPVLRRDGSRIRGGIVQVVIHQDDSIGLLRQILVVITPIRGGNRDHELQVRGVHRDRQIVDEPRKIRLAVLRHQFEIHDDAGLMLRGCKIRE